MTGFMVQGHNFTNVFIYLGNTALDWLIQYMVKMNSEICIKKNTLYFLYLNVINILDFNVIGTTILKTSLCSKKKKAVVPFQTGTNMHHLGTNKIQRCTFWKALPQWRLL